MRSFLNHSMIACLLLSPFTEASAQDAPKGPLQSAGRAVQNAIESRRARRELLEQRLKDARENGEVYRQRIQTNLHNQLTPAQRDTRRAEKAAAKTDQYQGDWRDWSRERYQVYGDWYRGPWRGFVATPATQNWWQYRWTRYPAYTTLGVGPWSAYRGAYTFGLAGYRNPFYVPPTASTAVVIDYGQPLYAAVGRQQTLDLGAFDQARKAFMNRDYTAALRLVDIAAAANPGDPVIHEFRSLVLFALKQYEASALAAYAVLAAGPPWSYETMIGLYPDESTYLGHLQQLERYRADHFEKPETRFLSGYHYLVKGDNDSAAREIEAFLRLVPNDPVGIELAAMVGGKIPEKASVLATPKGNTRISSTKLIGTWRTNGSRAYELVLKDNGEFAWIRQGNQSPIEGIYVLDGSEVILESDDGSVIVGRVNPVENGFVIAIGDGDDLQLQLVR